MKKSRLVIAIAVSLFSLALVTGALAAASRRGASLGSTPPVVVPGALPEGDGPWVVRAYYDDPQMVAEVASRLEPWEVHPDEGYLVVEVNREQYMWLQWLGFRVEIDDKLTNLLLQPRVPLPDQVSGIPGYLCYRTVEETYDTAAQIVADHPGLASWIDIGDSWEKTQPGGLPGYEIMVLRLTNANIPDPKPKLFIMTAIHAREFATAELNTRFAEYMVENYDVDPDVTWLLDYNELHLLLITNPDGRKMAETGILWRKNTNNNYCSNTNNRGADLNRNFDFQWGCCGGSSGNQCDETYRGPSAASEPETQAVQNYVITEFPDQRPDDLTTPAPITATGIFMDIHAHGRMVLWPWGFNNTLQPPNATELQTLGRKFAFFNNYDPRHHIYYDVDGATDDFAYGRLGIASYVFEIGTSFFQDCGTFESTIMPDNLPSLVYAAKSARTPYMTPAGPEALNVAANPVAVAPGNPVSLTAVADDTRFNNQRGNEPTQDINAVEYYIDVPPWSTNPPPVAYTMAASDGAFDEKIEAVEAVVDTSGLSLGRHILYLRAQDADSNWGAVSSDFLYIIDPDASPIIQGYVRDYSNNTPLEADISAGTFGTTSNASTGFYSMAVVSSTYDMSAQASGYAVSSVPRVQALDYTTVQQNFILQPTCTIFSDDVESGNQGWTADTPWAITDENSNSPTHSWTDSPGGIYQNDKNISLTSPVFDLSTSSGVELNFWHIYDIEPIYDFGIVEYSTDGGTTWTQAASYNDYNDIWTQETIPIPQLDGHANARLRFRLDTDYSVNPDGWHIDDIELKGSDPSCYPPLAPTAEFTSNSPVLSGDLVRFTDQTQGTHPLSYFWDFGDGLGTSTQSDPFYTYTTNGTYLVTMTVTNSLGSDSVTHPVVVDVCIPVNGVTLTLQTTGTLLLGASLDFLVDIGPDDASKPYDYSVDYGDGSQVSDISSDDPFNLTHTYNQPGTFPVLFSAWNCGVAPLTDTLSVDITAEAGILITPTIASAVVLPGEMVTYTLRVTNTLTVSNSYEIALSGNNWLSEASAPTLGPLGANQGQDFTVQVHVPGDASGGDSDTVTVTISSKTPGILPVSSTLTTGAERVYGLDFQPGTSKMQGMPGTTVTHTLTLTNTGNTSDTYDLQVSSDWPISITVAPETVYQNGSVSLDRGQSAVLSALVSIPGSVNTGQQDIASLLVFSTGNPMVSQEVRLETTTVIINAWLPLIPTQFSTQP